jgi:aspartate/tyrosine/aromatic aminotransferase
MFNQVETAPPDAILGLTEAFNADENPQKINLSVGVYKDDSGATPVLNSVKVAEQRLVVEEKSKSYKPMTGDPAYGRLVQQLVLGADHPAMSEGRAVTAHTPGGTGALRVAADYLVRVHGGPTIWISEPTWANHKAVFTAAGLPIKTYPYFDASANAIDFDAMIGALQQIPAGDVVLLHGCCHNPTGADPSDEQWAKIADVLAERQLLPMIDFAYQGFADGLEEDASGVRAVVNRVPEVIICSSFSKNFGLYNERVGAVTFIAETPEAAQAVISHVKLCIRTNYSNPPAHGAAIVTAVLGDRDLREEWAGEVAAMRNRINQTRRQFVDALARHGASRDFSFITRQRGMFSFSGLTKDQVETLRQKYSIYIVGSGRINVAGITSANIDRLCEAVVEVLNN